MYLSQEYVAKDLSLPLCIHPTSCPQLKQEETQTQRYTVKLPVGPPTQRLHCKVFT